MQSAAILKLNCVYSDTPGDSDNNKKKYCKKHWYTQESFPYNKSPFFSTNYGKRAQSIAGTYLL